ncbi:hypothetical protein A2892_01130 [Candidatus Woesebacteria bacterium RIFCSPLOWO2_01_FULL_39_10b]|uniref:Glycosyltransferase RgtA/B/C/D-like domain-containing protein n=1 Tax=Candidatus Woesebacteria bacterium RIFCSPLOWO2_01_FULL_39_10b TaxID=1802517 RepID=A0A1F8B9A7_9BACT|nr:MAG: hypothetical protein A2892_01130 [Candidatus Woesebacteria bacterium RIFCSPLOWO2_01_FULL_39_10b]
MIAARDWYQFIFYLVLSFIYFFCFFYIPGANLLAKEKSLKNSEKFIIAPFLGISLWSLVLYVLGYLGLRNFIYVYVLFNATFFLKSLRRHYLIFKKGIFSFFNDKFLLIIIILGLPVVLSGMFTSSLPNQTGLYFFGINFIDGTFHLSLVNSIKHAIPPEEPGMAGVLIQNYHYFSDLLVSEFVRVLKLPVANLYFHSFPLFFAISGGLLTYQVGVTFFKEKLAGRIFSFLFYFAGNFGYLVYYILKRELVFTLSSLDNSVLVFTNPPRLYAQILFLASLILLFRWQKSMKLSLGILMSVLVGVLVGFKVYLGIFYAFGFSILFLYYLLKKKLVMLIPMATASIIAITVFFPTNKNAGGLFYVPFSWPRHYFAQGTASNLQWHLKEQVFKEHNNVPRLAILYTQMSLLFIIITLGTRVLGVFGVLRLGKYLSTPMSLFLLVPTIIFTLIPIFTLQKSGLYDNFNFLAVAGLIYSLFTSLFLSEFCIKIRKKIIGYLCVAIFVILTLPRPISDALHFYNLFELKSGHFMNSSDLHFFENINKLTNYNDVILADPENSLNKYSPYLASMTDTKFYFSGDGIIQAHGIDTTGMRENLERIISSGFSRTILDEYEIDYILLRRDIERSVDKDLKRIIENDNWVLYKVV